MLLRYLYTQELPAAEDGGEGLAAGEMAKAADYFQAGGLFEHCVEQFKAGLRVGNVVERLVQAHDSQLDSLIGAATEYLKSNAASFQVARFMCCFPCFVCARWHACVHLQSVFPESGASMFTQSVLLTAGGPADSGCPAKAPRLGWSCG